MALTRRSNVPVTDSGGATSASAIVTRPSNAVSGDLIVALLATTNGGAETITPDAAGWTQRIDAGNNSFPSTTAGGQNIAIFTRVATGSDPSSWTFTIGDSANQWITCAIAWGDTGTPIFDGGNEGEDTAGPACATSSYTPTVNNCQVVSFFCNDDNQTITWTATSASSGNALTEIADHQESGNQMTVSANAETQTTAAATVHTATKSAGTRGAAYYIFAVQPNAGGGGGGGASGFPLLLSGFFTSSVSSNDRPRFILEAAFGGLPSDESYIWTTIHDTLDTTTRYMTGATWGRGRTNQLSTFETGTGSIVLRNEDRTWDPQNTASVFYPYVRPMLPLRGSFILDGVTYFMFLHYADGFPRRRVGPNVADVTVSTVDGQEGLALARIPPEKATLEVFQDGVNNDLLFTAKKPGPDGNDITVAFFQTHFVPLRKQRVVVTTTGTNIRVDYIDGTVQVEEVVAAIQHGAYISAVYSADPVSYWRFSESSGDFADRAGSHDGTAHGGISYSVAIEDAIGAAITLDGSTGYVTVADHADLDLGDVVCLEGWWTYGTGVLIDKGASAYRLEMTAGVVALQKSGVSTICTATVAVPDDNDLHHIVATKNGSTVHLYVDGSDVSGTVTNATLTNNATDLHIGRAAAGGSFYGGTLQHVAIYAEALSAGEVLTHYNDRYATNAADMLVDVENIIGSDGTGDMHPYPETHLSGGDTASFPAELGGARIERCLDLAAWPDSLRSISTGQDYHGALEFSTTEDGKVLSHMQEVASICSENGYLYVNGSGQLTFLDRVDKLTQNSLPAAVFSDQPISSDNVLTNPGFETDTSGWAGVGATITRTTAEKHSGAASCQVVVPDADPAQGIYLDTLAGAPGQIWAGSVWVKAPLGLALILQVWDGTLAPEGDNAYISFFGTGDWQYQQAVAVITTGATAVTLIVKTDSVAGTFYVDDADLHLVEFAYISSAPNESKDLIVNEAVATRADGDPQSAYDSESISRYRRRSRSFTSTLSTDSDVLAAVEAAVVEMGQPLQRIESITVMPGADSDFWTAVLNIEIGSRITVKENPPGGGDTIESDYIVQGLRWTVQPGPLTGTAITYNLWPADPISNWFILDDPVRGVLDAGNRLGR